MILWIAAACLASTVASAAESYSPSLLSTLTIWSSLPSITYNGPWKMIYPSAPPSESASYGPGSIGSGDWSAYQVNSTTGASFSVPFYGYGIWDVVMALTPFDVKQQTVNLTVSLDETTWSVQTNATPAARISSWKSTTPVGPVWPPINLGPLAMTTTAARHILNVTIPSNVIATFWLAHASYGMQTEAQGNTPVPIRSAGLALQSKINSAFSCAGDWSYVHMFGSPANFQIVEGMRGTPGSHCTIPLPANTTYLTVNGTMAYQQGTVNISLSTPPPVEGLPPTFSTNSNFNYSTDLYETPLDPTLLYNLTMAISGEGSAILEGVTLYSSLVDPNWAANFGVPPPGGVSPNSTTGSVSPNSTNNPTDNSNNNNSPNANPTHSGSGTNVAAIAGGVVGGVAALVAVLAMVIFFFRRNFIIIRKSTQTAQISPSRAIEDPAVEPFTSDRLSSILPVETDSTAEYSSKRLTSSSRPTSPPFSSPTATSASLGPSTRASASHHAQDGGAMGVLQPPIYDPGWRGVNSATSQIATDEGSARGASIRGEHRRSE